MELDTLRWQAAESWPVVVAVVAAAMAWWPLSRWIDRGVMQHVHASMIGAQRARGLRRRLVLRILATALFAVALLQPSWGRRELPSATMGRPVLLAVDLSRSMHATDVAPERLVRMRDVVDRLLDSHGDLRFALAVFAGDAWLRVPFTWDTDYIREILEQLSPEQIRPQGTDLLRPLDLAIDLVQKQGLTDLTMVLITDGEHTGDGSPLDRVDLLKSHGIRVLSVAIGDAAGAPIPTRDGYVRDRNGDLVMSRPDIETLKVLAQQTGGAFVQIDGQTLDLNPLSRPLAEIEARRMADVTRSQRIDRAEWPIGAGLLLLLASLLPLGWRRERRALRGAMIVAVITPLLGASGCTPDRAAREALEHGKADEAAQWYGQRAAATRDPAALTNLGLALLKGEHYAEAVSALVAAAAAVSDPVERARTLHDAGNAAALGGDLETAAALYRQALALHDDEDTAWNLKVVEARLQQLQQQYQQQMQQRQQQAGAATDQTSQEPSTDATGQMQQRQDGGQSNSQDQTSSARQAQSKDDTQQPSRPEGAAAAAKPQHGDAPKDGEQIGVLLRKRIENLEEADPMQLQGEQQDLEKNW